MKRSAALGFAAAVLTSTVVTTGAATPSAPAPAPAPPSPGLAWGPCPKDIADKYPAMQCASLDVPLDYTHPQGEQVKLTVSKLPARDPAKRRGSLLVNPGGPGGPGVAFAGRMSQDLPPQVLDSYDLIGFDTRNSGHSTPIHCADPAQYWKAPMPDPDAPENRDQYWQRAENYAQGCEQHAGKYLPHLTTPNNARDMDRIRAALGEQKISYLGYSYGTYLGAVYGQLFPQRVDRMILDSSVNPDTSKVWYRDNLSQDVAGQKRLGLFFDWIAQYDDVFHLGTNREQVKGAWDDTKARLRKQPTGEVGPYELIDTTFNALYGEKEWVDLAHALADFHNNNDGRKLNEIRSTYDADAETENAIYNSVECADAPWPTSRAKWEADSKKLERTAPMAAWFNSWGVAPCAHWPGGHHKPVKITGQGLPGILMFNSVHDVATPYEGAQEMHKRLPTSVFVTQRDAGKHGVYASGGLARNPAADRIGTDYLVHGALPEQDTSIPGHPFPNPHDPKSVQAAKLSSSPGA